MALDASSPKVHERVIEFQHDLNSELNSLPPQVAEVVKSEVKGLPAASDLKKFNEDFAVKHKDSALHLLSTIRARKTLGEEKAKCEKDLVGLLQLKQISFTEAGEVLQSLEAWRSSEVEGFKAAARGKWPEATMFA